jgi:hypothetical protein
MRYGPDRRVAEIYNNAHHTLHSPRCAGPTRLLIQWFDPDGRSREIPEDDEMGSWIGGHPSLRRGKQKDKLPDPIKVRRSYPLDGLPSRPR